MRVLTSSIFSLKIGSQAISMFEGSIPAGFPSPAGDYLEPRIDLEAYVSDHPNATFCVKATGDSMIGVGICSGDMLIVDKALHAVSGDVVIAVLNQEFTVKELRKKGTQLSLVAHNPIFKSIIIGESDELSIWGVVTAVIKDFKKRSVHARNR